MKKTLIMFLFLATAPAFRAQTTSFCDADFSCNVPLITFGDQQMAVWGDSAVTIRISNNSSVSFAYPQAKLFAITPLPPGMTLNSNFDWWYPFASSWNPGDTAIYPCGYDVAQPIPANYTVTFRLWLRPNDTAAGFDSCVFSQDFTLNLNPMTGIGEFSGTGATVSVFPNPATELVTFTAADVRVQLSAAVIVNSCGQQVLTATLQDNRMSVAALPAGMYVVYLLDKEGKVAGNAKLLK